MKDRMEKGQAEMKDRMEKGQEWKKRTREIEKDKKNEESDPITSETAFREYLHKLTDLMTIENAQARFGTVTQFYRTELKTRRQKPWGKPQALAADEATNEHTESPYGCSRRV
ncbi:hypothetical protein AVEN_91166-1 [Araneus ventricosus]|uniref:Uncharacterized protein n=1 Tax=Araneus ventricosus TaxID=182803 RepID=A0A4Y2E6B9_ARAVE|nr:hypothetical protein AVEN_91166-1 [Araneus ventricosus]